MWTRAFPETSVGLPRIVWSWKVCESAELRGAAASPLSLLLPDSKNGGKTTLGGEKGCTPLDRKLHRFSLLHRSHTSASTTSSAFDWWLERCGVFACRRVTVCWNIFKKQYSRWLLDGKTCYFCSWDLLIYVYISRISDIKPVSVHKLGKQSYLWSTLNFCLNPSVEAPIWITIFIFFIFKIRTRKLPLLFRVREQHPTQIV